jgi:hypothetical protein
MSAKNGIGLGTMREERKSGFGNDRKDTKNVDFLPPSLGQRYPQHYPYLEGPVREIGALDVLGEPLDIRGVAALLGCSAWTVRQRYLPAGLPYFRNGRHGKLVFYRNQVVLWILEKQKQRKGGAIR